MSAILHTFLFLPHSALLMLPGVREDAVFRPYEPYTEKEKTSWEKMDAVSDMFKEIQHEQTPKPRKRKRKRRLPETQDITEWTKQWANRILDKSKDTIDQLSCVLSYLSDNTQPRKPNELLCLLSIDCMYTLEQAEKVLDVQVLHSQLVRAVSSQQSGRPSMPSLACARYPGQVGPAAAQYVSRIQPARQADSEDEGP